MIEISPQWHQTGISSPSHPSCAPARPPKEALSEPSVNPWLIVVPPEPHLCSQGPGRSLCYLSRLADHRKMQCFVKCVLSLFAYCGRLWEAKWEGWRNWVICLGDQHQPVFHSESSRVPQAGGEKKTNQETQKAPAFSIPFLNICPRMGIFRNQSTTYWIYKIKRKIQYSFITSNQTLFWTQILWAKSKWFTSVAISKTDFILEFIKKHVLCNKNTFTVLRLYILILFPSALLLKEHSHVKINLLPSPSSVRTVPWHSVHPKNSLHSLKPGPAKGDSDKLPEMNDSGNAAFLKQIPSKNYIKKYLYSSGLANICVDSSSTDSIYHMLTGCSHYSNTNCSVQRLRGTRGEKAL